ncbi:MAG: prenyltransferase/squalene oxidase repeat-containing protein, partial [Candidatus Thorarchaeota archaeon]
MGNQKAAFAVLLVIILLGSSLPLFLSGPITLPTSENEVLEMAPQGYSESAESGIWETSAFGNISLMVKGNFSENKDHDFIIVNGSTPGQFPVLFDEYSTITGNTIHLIDGNSGNLMWSKTINNTVTDLDIADIDGDGFDDIIVSVLRWNASDSSDHYKIDNGGQLFALNRTGHTLWNHTSNANGAYISVIGNFTADDKLDVATVWTNDMFNYNVTFYTAEDGSQWDSYLGTQYQHKNWYDNGTLYTNPSHTYGYMAVPIQGVAVDYDQDGLDTLILQANRGVYNDTDSHETLEETSMLLYHYEGLSGYVEFNVTFAAPTGSQGFDFYAPEVVAGNFIDNSNLEELGIAVPLNDTHRVVNVFDDSGTILATKTLVRSYTAKLMAVDINADGIDDLILSDVNLDGHGGMPSPAVLAVLDGTNLDVLFEVLPGVSGSEGFLALQFDVGDISTDNGLEIVVSGMNSLVVVNSTGNVIYHETFTGLGYYSFFSDTDVDGKPEIVRAYSTWSIFGASGYTTYISTINDFVMMVPGSLTVDEWIVAPNENATISAQFIAPFETLSGVNISIWNVSAQPGPGYITYTVLGPILDTKLVDFVAGVPYAYDFEYNTTTIMSNQLAFSINNVSSASTTVGIFSIDLLQAASYTDYEDLINKGLDWILNEQNSDGSWNYSLEDGNWIVPSVASTAMSVITLLNNDTIGTPVTSAIDWILNQRNTTTGSIFHPYQNATDVIETIWGLLALNAYNATLMTANTTIMGTITNATNWLAGAQYSDGDLYWDNGWTPIEAPYGYYGGWSEQFNGTDDPEPADMYVTSLALLALSQVGYTNSETFDAADVFIIHAQNDLYTNPFGLRTNDGGFLGIPSRQVGSMGSATGAGLLAMYLTGGSTDNPDGYQAASDWINTNFILDEHVGVENYMGGLFYTRMLAITDYWFYLNLGMTTGNEYFTEDQFAALDLAIANGAAEDAGDTAIWLGLFGDDTLEQTAKCIMSLQTRHGPNAGTLRVEMHSDAYLSMISPDGSATIGYNYTSGTDMTPLGATYSGAASEPQIIEIPNPEIGIWTIVGDGNATGSFDLIITIYSLGGLPVFSQSYSDYMVNGTTSWELSLDIMRPIIPIATLVGELSVEYDYEITISSLDVTYSDPTTNAVVEVTAESSDPIIDDIEDTEALEHIWYLYSITDNSTPIQAGSLVWNIVASSWTGAADTTLIANGEYYFSVSFRTIRTVSTVRNQSESITVAHYLSGSLPTLSYGQDTQSIESASFAVTSTYFPHGDVDDTEATTHTWYLYDAASGGNQVKTGSLDYDSGVFSIANTSVD